MELRKDYILDQYAIIATNRAKRPDQFRKEKEKSDPSKCFFCPGKEGTTPPEIGRVGGNDWHIRWFANKFPFIDTDSDPSIRQEGFYKHGGAFGYHEIIVETPKHHDHLGDLSEHHLKEMIDVYDNRIIELSRKNDIRYVQVFKNQGKDAGASLPHSHTQVAATSIIPPLIEEKENKSFDEEGCIYCRILHQEENTERHIYKNEHIVAFTPYASTTPFEVMFFPRRHITRLSEMTDEERYSLAAAMKKVLAKLKELNIPFNYYLHYGLSRMHFHIHLVTRVNKRAGFELSTNMFVNTMTPEAAAEFYKS